MINVNSNISIILGIAVLAAIAIASFFYLRNAKGTIEFTLDQTTFQPGDLISGQFIITHKKSAKGKGVVASLIGTEKETTRDHRNTSRTKEREVFREDVMVEAARDYPAGMMTEYVFGIAIPNANAPIVPKDKSGKTLKFADDFLSNPNVTWNVEVRMHAKGIDLSESQKITIETDQ